MKVKLLGLKQMDFTPKGESKAIEGTYIYIAYKSLNTSGLECTKKFISAEHYPEIVMIDLAQFINKEIDLDMGFNNVVNAITA